MQICAQYEPGPAPDPGNRTSTDHRTRAVLLLLLSFSVFACDREVVVPPYLLGTWKTNTLIYANRSLKFGERTLVYGVGDDQQIPNTIQRIESRKTAESTVFTFYYTDPEEEEGMLTFIYRPDSGGTIQLNNSEHIWRREKPGDAG